MSKIINCFCGLRETELSTLPYVFGTGCWESTVYKITFHCFYIILLPNKRKSESEHNINTFLIIVLHLRQLAAQIRLNFISIKRNIPWTETIKIPSATLHRYTNHQKIIIFFVARKTVELILPPPKKIYSFHTSFLVSQ